MLNLDPGDGKERAENGVGLLWEIEKQMEIDATVNGREDVACDRVGKTWKKQNVTHYVFFANIIMTHRLYYCDCDLV